MTWTITLLSVAVFLLAYSNGANDNFKGVATLYGSKTATYRVALVWTTVFTILGSLVSILFAAKLAAVFSGKGLIPDELAGSPELLLAVGVAGATTILLATLLGMPTSTTHALTGALVGAGLVSGIENVNFATLGTKFAQPLLISPIVAVFGASVLYVLFSTLRKRWGVEEKTIIGIGQSKPSPSMITQSDGTAVLSERSTSPATSVQISIDRDPNAKKYTGHVIGVPAQTVVDVTHFASAAAVSFARAVNDTPKIAILLLAAGVMGGSNVLVLGVVAIAMAVGGILNSKRVAETMSNHITSLNSGQGLTANLTTAGLVLVASRWGLPVSTTHVSCASIFGIGVVNGQREWKTISRIAITWLTTLPLGMAIGAGVYWLARSFA